MEFDFDLRLQIRRAIAKPDNDKPKHIAWVYSCLHVMELMHNSFLEYREQKLLELSYNGQTMMLEYALNNTYPEAAGLIYIDNQTINNDSVYINFLSESDEPNYIYFLSENVDQYVGYLSEGTLSVDFVVYYPNTFAPDRNQMAAFIKKYAVAGKRFILKIYSV